MAERPAEQSRPSLPGWARQPNQPATYPRLFVQVAEERGVPAAAVLHHARLRADLLDDPAGRLSAQHTLAIIEAVCALTGDGAIGFEAGYRQPLTAHGSLGYALLCAPDARAAIHILERFWHLRGRAVLMRFEEQRDAVICELTHELPMAASVRDVLLSSMLASMVRGIGFVLGEHAPSIELWLPGPEPAGFAAWRDRLPPVRFDRPSAQLRLVGDRSPLDRALSTANPEGLAQALAQCERESALMGDAPDPVLAKTRAALQLAADGYPTPDALAALLHMTPRTFRRRLREQGGSYKQLLEEARRRDACRLLDQPELELRRIAELLGYADPANFTRAFKSWTGRAPREWRAEKVRKERALSRPGCPER